MSGEPDFRFTLRQLQYFSAIAEHGSISRAAVAAHLSQAAMSQALAELEAAVGQQLAVRSKARGVTLTSAGRRLLADARRLLGDAAEIQAVMSERADELAGPIELGCYTSLSPYWIPFLAERFIRPNPRLDVRIEEGDGKALQRRMLEGRLDAVLTHTGHLVEGVRHTTLRSGRGYVVVAADHPLAGRGRVHLRELAHEDYVLLDIPSVREGQLPKLRRARFDPRVVWRSSSFEAVRGMVARGLGWTILVQRPASDVTYDGRTVACLDIADDFDASDVCIAHVADPMSRRLRALVDLCRDEGGRLDAEASGRPPDGVDPLSASPR